METKEEQPRNSSDKAVLAPLQGEYITIYLGGKKRKKEKVFTVEQNLWS